MNPILSSLIFENLDFSLGIIKVQVLKRCIFRFLWPAVFSRNGLAQLGANLAFHVFFWAAVFLNFDFLVIGFSFGRRLSVWNYEWIMVSVVRRWLGWSNVLQSFQPHVESRKQFPRLRASRKSNLGNNTSARASDRANGRMMRWKLIENWSYLELQKSFRRVDKYARSDFSN